MEEAEDRDPPRGVLAVDGKRVGCASVTTRAIYRLDGDELTVHTVGHRVDVYHT